MNKTETTKTQITTEIIKSETIKIENSESEKIEVSNIPLFVAALASIAAACTSLLINNVSWAIFVLICGLTLAQGSLDFYKDKDKKPLWMLATRVIGLALAGFALVARPDLITGVTNLLQSKVN